MTELALMQSFYASAITLVGIIMVCVVVPISTVFILKANPSNGKTA